MDALRRNSDVPGSPYILYDFLASMRQAERRETGDRGILHCKYLLVLIRRAKSSKKRVPRGNGINGTSKIILRNCDHVRKAEGFA
jgi:hypothetical protein